MAAANEALFEPRVRDFLAAARVARLATADRDARPHLVPVCFWLEGERLYFAIDDKPKRNHGLRLKRMRNIAANPRVAMLFDHYEEDWTQLGYVLVHGTAHLVDSPQEYMLALRGLRGKYAQYRAMALVPDKNPIVRIDPERVHVWGARFGSSGPA